MDISEWINKRSIRANETTLIDPLIICLQQQKSRNYDLSWFAVIPTASSATLWSIIVNT